MKTTPNRILVKCDEAESTVTISPDWQPMETAPKDGSVIRLARQWVHNETGELKYQHTDVFWGKMSSFPDCGDVWVTVDNPCNGLVDESEFIRQSTIYNQYGKDETHLYFRGGRIIGWTRPWEIKIEVKYPSINPPIFTEIIYDNRKKR